MSSSTFNEAKISFDLSKLLIHQIKVLISSKDTGSPSGGIYLSSLVGKVILFINKLFLGSDLFMGFPLLPPFKRLL